jgi:hypothetical protein
MIFAVVATIIVLAFLTFIVFMSLPGAMVDAREAEKQEREL